ncbi:MAG: hypothetical protein P8N02_09705, partial [Actinomycetota bacterium]|nr:hypothetical protein [Actinomycetota bacterium]
MNLNTLLRVVLHHKIVVSALIVITISTAWGFWVSVLPSYKTEATVWVIPPDRTVDGDSTNPLTGLAAQSNDIVARALALSVNSPEWRGPLVDQGYAPDYLVDDGDGSSPLLSILVTADDQDVALVTRDAVIEAIQQELVNTQQELGVPAEDRYVVLPVTVLPARVQYGSRDRLVASTVLLGLLAAVAVALLLDAFER